MAEIRLGYESGITRRPSDLACKDGQLTECINFVEEGGEMRPIQTPVKKFDRPFITASGAVIKLLCIHLTNSGERNYIGICYQTLFYGQPTDGGWAVRQIKVFTGSTEGLQVTAIGNTLIVRSDSGINYFLWKGSTYKDIGDRLPEPVMEFKTGYNKYNDPEGQILNEMKDVKTKGSYLDILDSVHKIKDEKQDAYNDLVIGLYNENLTKLKKQELFSGPFFIRYALKLYDGSYTYLSNPIFMPAFLNKNCEGIFHETDKLTLISYGLKVYYRNLTDYTNYSDIVKGITVFVSECISLYDLTDDQPAPVAATEGCKMSFGGGIKTVSLSNGYDCFQLKETEDLYRELGEVRNYYKLFEIDGTSIDSDWVSSRHAIAPDTLLYLNQQERIETEDYYSHCAMNGSSLFVYNNRLNIGNIDRGFFNGFSNFVSFGTTETTYTSFVHIETDEGEVVVKNTYTTSQKQGLWFFYPDTRAKRALIYSGGTTPIASFDLTEHTGLNGAYFIPTSPLDVTADATNTYSTVTLADETAAAEASPLFEHLGNRLVQSRVNNPYVFDAAGYNSVGHGEVLGMASTTTALSQCSFGSYPLIIFTTDGMWAASLDSTGVYTNILPMGRDVCSSAATITPIDNAVCFVSQKGLMITSNGTTKCITEQMRGIAPDITSITNIRGNLAPLINSANSQTSFNDWLTTAQIAYDYKDSRLVIINGTSFAYIVDLKTGAVSKMVTADGTLTNSSDAVKFNNAVNDYPDYLLQDTKGYLYSLYDKPEDSLSEETLPCFLLTRPLKLDDPMAVKSVMQIMNVGTFAPVNLSLRLYVSDDLRTWYQKTSRQGEAAKYFRIAVYASLAPYERFTGTVVITQPRRTERIR